MQTAQEADFYEFRKYGSQNWNLHSIALFHFKMSTIQTGHYWTMKLLLPLEDSQLLTYFLNCSVQKQEPFIIVTSRKFLKDWLNQLDKKPDFFQPSKYEIQNWSLLITCKEPLVLFYRKMCTSQTASNDRWNFNSLQTNRYCKHDESSIKNRCKFWLLAFNICLSKNLRHPNQETFTICRRNSWEAVSFTQQEDETFATPESTLLLIIETYSPSVSHAQND